MHIVHIDVRNFRGIKALEWSPAAGINCLIGPGDATKTTVLDAIELALNPRSYPFADDADFFDLDADQSIRITVTLVDLPGEFTADDRYGLHLRGWDADKRVLHDEPAIGLLEALSLRVEIDSSLEARWSIFNDRIGEDNDDPPMLRYKHSQQLVTSRLGPYAERHLSWGRQSVLTQLGGASATLGMQLAQASRSARKAFRQGNENIFKETVARAEVLSKKFAVPIRDKYAAELDVRGVTITAGGIALHDGRVPLRRLGSGSSRLVVSALQHDAGASHIALIDEIEHGLEPHRIARLLKYLSSPPVVGDTAVPQIFLTTHSPVVIQELTAPHVFSVRSKGGTTIVRSVLEAAADTDEAQRHLRRSPAAFLARKIVVGEGKTEQGLCRGLDSCWCSRGLESFALCGVSVVDGGGNPNVLMIAELLCDLGHDTFVLLDSDKPADQSVVARLRQKGATVHEWPDACATEERIFLDVPFRTVRELVAFAGECIGADSVKDSINHACSKLGAPTVTELGLPEAFDKQNYRRAIGKVANAKDWYKDIARGERLAEIVMAAYGEMPKKPLTAAIDVLRQWADA
jgi:predicted ATPase